MKKINCFEIRQKTIRLLNFFLLAVNSIHRLVEHAMIKVGNKICSKITNFDEVLLDCHEGIQRYEPLKKPFQPIQPLKELMLFDKYHS